MFTSLDISTSGMVAQRTRMDVVAGNLAMSDVTEDEYGRPNPYRRRFVVFRPGSSAGDDLEFTADHPLEGEDPIEFEVTVHEVREKVHDVRIDARILERAV